MRIDPAAALQAALLGLMKAGKDGGAPAPAFRADSPPAPAPAPPAAPSAPPPAASVAMLVTIAAATPRAQRSPALARAERGVEALGRLHRAMLTGAPVGEVLAGLRDWRGEQAEEAEGELGRLMRDVELRILVELAKRGG